MKPISSLINDKLRNLTPCVHGGEVLDAAEKTGFHREDILDFSSSVNPLGPSQKVLNTIVDSFSRIQAYPDSNSNELRAVIAKHYCVTKNNIIMGNGSTELMYLFCEVFLKPGEYAAMPAPTFGEYESAVRKTGSAVRFIKLEGDFQIDADSFLEQVKGAKIIFICTPNNPTSMLAPTAELTKIIQTAMERDCLVFLDEDFLEFIEGERELSMVSKINIYPNLFILKSFTKIYGLTGLRIGYGIANQDIIDVMTCSKIPWNLNCLGQAAAVTALQDNEHLQRTLTLIKTEKAYLQEGLRQISGFKLFPADANFFFIDIRKTGFTAAQLSQKMLEQGLLIRDCTSFRGLDEYFVRIAVKTRSENERLLNALRGIVKA
ncbi:MAG: threonine-phosphate decarboxylase CobD [Candidatus Bathyarchaeota archaeon]|nr:threonine-phosphate decarboxylase CobD [Candidatus Bathyarchaeota archaeon]